MHPEELGLLDVVHNVAYYNKLSNPAYEHLGAGNWELMYTHPPTHYLLMGLAHKFLPLHYTLALLPLLYFSLILYFAATMKTFSEIRYACMFSAFLLIIASLGTFVNFTVRPDLALTLCWFAGILALEKGRLNNWRQRDLFVGSMLLVLASTTHYWAFPAFIGVLAYVVAGMKEKGWQQARQWLLPIVAGGAIIGIPFLIFFVARYYVEITEMTTAVMEGDPEASRSIFENLMVHVRSQKEYNGDYQAFTPYLLHRYYVPVGLVAALLLILIKKTRVLGAAFMAFIFFLTFVIKYKKPYYVFPEWLLFYLIVFLGIGFLCSMIFKKQLHPARFQRIAGIIAILFSCYLLTASKLNCLFSIQTIFPVHQMDVARIAAQKIIGTNALIGGMIETWYIAGGAEWYCEDAGMMANRPENLQEYLQGADYFAVYTVVEPDSFNELDTPAVLVPALYLQNEVHLVSATFAPQDARYVLFSAIKPGQMANPIFYSLDERTISEFKVDESGTYKLGTLTCSERIEETHPEPAFEHRISMRTYLKAGRDSQFVTAFIAPGEHFEEIREKLSSVCRPLEVYNVRKTTFSHRDFIKTVPDLNPQVKFYRNQQEAHSK